MGLSDKQLHEVGLIAAQGAAQLFVNDHVNRAAAAQVASSVSSPPGRLFNPAVDVTQPSGGQAELDDGMEGSRRLAAVVAQAYIAAKMIAQLKPGQAAKPSPKTDDPVVDAWMGNGAALKDA